MKRFSQLPERNQGWHHQQHPCQVGIAPPSEKIGREPGDQPDKCCGQQPGAAAGEKQPCPCIDHHRGQAVEQLAVLQHQIGDPKAIQPAVQPGQPGHTSMVPPMVEQQPPRKIRVKVGRESACIEQQTDDGDMVYRVDPGRQRQPAQMKQACGQGEGQNTGEKGSPETLASQRNAAGPAPGWPEQRNRAGQQPAPCGDLGSSCCPTPAERAAPEQQQRPERQPQAQLERQGDQPVGVQRQPQQAVQKGTRQPEQQQAPNPDLPARGIDLHANRVYSKSRVKSQPGEEAAGLGGAGTKHGERFENRSPKSPTDLRRHVFVGAALKRRFDDQALVDSPAAERGENLCYGDRIGLPNDIV